MYEKLREHILPQLIPPNARVLVAVSGGPDSIALSHMLWRYVQEEHSKGISLVLTHVHHGVRKESDDEVILVQALAAKWKIPCIVHHFDAKGYAKRVKKSFQEAARDWRYARWEEDMQKEGCTLLATAHHLGDQAETILYRLLRGSGTAGLAGIYPAKNQVIRPLLNVKKADILSYCEQEGLPFALDQSNEEPVYVRNRIRLELLPELERHYNPRVQEALGRMGELLRWDEEYLADQAEYRWEKYILKDPRGRTGLSRAAFKEPRAMLSRLLRKAAMQVSQNPRGLGFNYVMSIMDALEKPEWKQNLPGMMVEMNEEGIWFQSRERDEVLKGALKVTVGTSLTRQGGPAAAVLNIGQWTEVPTLKLDVGLIDEQDSAMSDVQGTKGDSVAVFGYELLKQSNYPLVCRTRREGDRMWFQGVGHKSLKKVFQEEKIPAERRDALPLIAYGSEVLWIPGVRQSDLYRADVADEKVYCVIRPYVSSNLDSL